MWWLECTRLPPRDRRWKRICREGNQCNRQLLSPRCCWWSIAQQHRHRSTGSLPARRIRIVRQHTGRSTGPLTDQQIRNARQRTISSTGCSILLHLAKTIVQAYTRPSTGLLTVRQIRIAPQHRYRSTGPLSVVRIRIVLLYIHRSWSRPASCISHRGSRCSAWPLYPRRCHQRSQL